MLVGQLGPQGHRWVPGERLHHVFEERCDALAAAGVTDRLAVDTGEVRLTYADLEARANRLAARLRRRGVGPGSRVALLCDDPVATYTALLGTLKAGAAYVPLDVAFPTDRIGFIVEDAAVDLLVTTATARPRLDGLAVPVLDLYAAADAVDGEDAGRPASEAAGPDDALCYVVYTSGTTGRPKGVAVDHSSICHFVRVAAEVYGVRGDDRVYQGLTVAFDFSVEEIWVAWAVGATLVPRPRGGQLLGSELHEFLAVNDVTAMCCVPTLLATVEEDLPGLRFLLVSGEACPEELAARWQRPGRRFLNVYGPTEATVTATWTVVLPDRPVTLGEPLPGYSVLVLAPGEDRPLRTGELGELAIAGIGLARGYLGRPDLTARAFVADPLGLPDNPSRRVYRTGDLARIVDGRVEYHGRIDLQVKIRGYRIELGEIESVLLELPEIAQAVVAPHEVAPGATELVAYYSRRSTAQQLDHVAVYGHLRSRLAAYMVPAYLEELPVIPMTTSDKADRKALPAPRSPRSLAAAGPRVGPVTTLEHVLADAAAAELGLDEVSVTSHLVEELGANSLLLTRMCARVRARPDLPRLSIKDVYLHPTVRALAAELAQRDAPPPGSAPAPEPTASPGPAPRAPYRHAVCGGLQVTLFLCWTCLIANTLLVGHRWVTQADGFVDSYWRMVAFGAAAFLGTCLFPVVAKWVLIGRWRPERFPVWSLRYLRLWVVKALVRASPLALFTGSPMVVLLLRALGARVGPGALILTSRIPVCTDLLTIEAGAVVRKDSFLNGYRITGGHVETGPVHIGRDAVIGEMTVLDVDTRVGDGAQLAHASSLHPGQSVPPGERWLGSPAESAGAALPGPAPARCGPARRFTFALLQVATAVLFWTPLLLSVTFTVLPEYEEIGRLPLADPRFYLGHALLLSCLFWGLVVGGLLVAVTLSRPISRVVPPDRVFPLYGWRYATQRTVSRYTNLKFFTYLFGDSSAIPHWLRALGWDLSRLEQSGSNFGMSVKHDVPGISAVGTGTMVSDGLSMINAAYSSTSFLVRRTAVGARNFLGNNIGFPAGGRTGDNVLLATKVHVPVDGPVHENTGLLGSPPFEIPRSVERDRVGYRCAGRLARRLAIRAKNRHNLVSALLYLGVRWVHFVAVTLIGVVSVDQYGRLGFAIVAVGIVGMLLFTTGWFVLVERAFPRRRPLLCSIYDLDFWRHERYWKVPGIAYVEVFNGTPFKSLVYRALGVRIGRRVLDDGAWLTERNLVAIGDDCVLNEGVTIQSHSLEDGVFKSDHIAVGGRCTLGTGAFVHYGVRMADGADLAADSFLMKGELVGVGERWAGNPAQLLSGAVPAPPPIPRAVRRIGRAAPSPAGARHP